MILFRQAVPLHNYIEKLKINGRSVGFIPTMGALHKGHESLIQIAQTSSDITVCSIFVNPTQFNDQNDYEKYPVTIGEDIIKLEKINCDILFLPSVDEIYPEGSTSATFYNLGELETVLEGHYRPGHFQGVCQVIDRLLQIVHPDKMYLGQKDYQQLLVIEKLVSLLQMPVEVVACPTLRETSGLAMSSRNTRLTEQQKESASHIYTTLLHVKKDLRHAPLRTIEQHATEYLLAHGFEKVDYVSIVNASNLSALSGYDGTTQASVLIAAFIGGVRLIDNIIVTQ